MNAHRTTTWRAACALGLSAVIGLGVVPMAAADSPEFGVLYTGEFDDADARVFRDRMRALGWYQEVFKTSHAASSTDRPRHYNFTHGVDDKQTQAGDDCDILYVSGHGWRRAKIPIYDNRPQVVDSISADSQCVGGPSVHPWEIGVDWLGQFPSNESRWDYDLEWAIFAACLQLDNRTTSDKLAYSNNAPRESSAKAWGRTLLGTPGRMHGIFGYWDVAPAGSYDTYVVNDFFTHAAGHDDTVGTAWAQANAKYGWSWAFLTHSENRNDRLHGQGAGPTADTKATSAYHVDYYKSALSGRILDGRGGAYEQLSDAGSGTLGHWLKVLLGGVEQAFANESDRRVRSQKRTFELPRRVGGGEKQYAAFDAEPVRLDPLVLLQGAPLSIETSQGPNGRSHEAHGTGSGRDGLERAVVQANGRFEYHSGRGVGVERVALQRDEVVEIARGYLSGVDPSFASATPAEIRTVTRERMEFDSSTPGTETIVQYEVRFAQRARGLYVDGPGVGACVTVDSLGVGDAYGYWVDGRSLRRRSARINSVGAHQALEANAQEIGGLIKLPEGEIPLHAADVVLHIDPDASSALEPAWRFETGDATAFYVRAQGDGVFR